MSISGRNASNRKRLQTRHCLWEPLEVRYALSAVAPQPEAVTSLETEEPAIVAPLHDTGTPHDEGLHYPGDVTVTATHIISPTEKVPRFAAQPTISTIRSGNWQDPATWSLGRVPRAGDRVLIAENMVVNYSTVSDAALDAIELSGQLLFSTSANTRLTIGTLTVMPTGTLQIGTAAQPVQANVKAELVFADKALDLVKDPSQYGTGLIVFGKIEIQGAVSNKTWTRLADEPLAGQRSLLLSESVSGWKAGDTLVLPDTRQVKASQDKHFENGEIPPQWEEVVIDRIVGNRVYLKTALQFDHPGARNVDGQLELLPHVAQLDRNVVLRSQNPLGTRGHTMYIARADVKIQFARFQDLGRTDAFRPLDSTKYDAQGNVTHVGTNQIGRYAVHLHHMQGPENPTNLGYQFLFVGNTVDRSKKWGVAVHDTSYGLLNRNVIYDAQGAGFVTEDGSEIGNVFAANMTVRIQGTFQDGKEGTAENDFGRGGSGFWFRRGGNSVISNVAADSTYAGFVIDAYNDTGDILLPLFRGADKHAPGQGYVTAYTPTPPMVNNEAYGMSTHGLWAAFIAGVNSGESHPTTLIQNLRLWHIGKAGVAAYHTANVTFDNVLVLGQAGALDRNDSGPRGMEFITYENRNLKVRNTRIEGYYIGIRTPANDASQPGIERPTIIENSTLKNYINVWVTPPLDITGGGNSLVLRNIRFTINNTLPNGPLSSSLVDRPANIAMKYLGTDVDYTQTSNVRVYDYNGVPGNNFQVFYVEQAGNSPMPQTDPRMLWERVSGRIGVPEAWLNNQQSWNKYGIATAGALLPTNATVRAGITGFVAPIQTAPSVPRLVLVTPWADAQIDGPGVRIRHTVIGALPPGANVYFSLDGAPPMANIKDGGFYNLSVGQHTLRAYIGDANGNQLPGTVAVNRTFTIRAVSTALALVEPGQKELSAVASALASLGSDEPASLAVRPAEGPRREDEKPVAAAGSAAAFVASAADDPIGLDERTASEGPLDEDFLEILAAAVAPLAR